MATQASESNERLGSWRSTLEMVLHSPPAPGMADIYCAGPADIERTGFLAAALAVVGDGEGPSADTVTVVLPTAEAGGPDPAAVHSLVAKFATVLVDGGAGEGPPAWVTDRVRIVRGVDFEAASLIAALSSPAQRQVFLVVDAALYRRPDETPVRSGGLRQAEDIWCNQLAATATVVVAACKANGAYVLLDAGEDPPRSRANQAALESVDDCGVTLGMAGGPLPIDLGPYLKGWGDLIAEGRVGAVLQAIDALPDAGVARRPLRIQMMSHAGLHAPAMAELGVELGETPRPDPELGVAFAKAALAAHDDELAERLLTEAAPQLVGQETLSAALELADQLGAEAVVSLVAGRLERLFPQAAILVDLRIRNAVRARDYRLASAVLLAAGRVEEGGFYAWLATALAASPSSDSGFPEALARQWPDQVGSGLVAAALQAEHDGDLPRATHLLMSRAAPQLATPGEAQQLLRLIRKRYLHSADDDTLEADLVEVLTATFAYLGENPADAVVRQRVGRLLSPEVSGARGFACGVLALVGLTFLPQEIGAHAARDDDPDTDIDALLEAAVDHFEREPFNGIGLSRLPASVLTQDFNPHIDRALLRIVDRLPIETDDADELDNALSIVGLVTALAPHLADPETDLAAIRTTAAKLVIAGRMQRARDLVEVVLQIAGDQPIRRRLAWMSYGDTYLRTGDRTEALVALGAGLTCLGPIPVGQAWTESLALSRLFRDVGVPGPALRVLDRAEDFMRAFGLLEANAGVLEAQRLLVEMFGATRTGSIAQDALQALLPRIATATEAVIARSVELPTLATLLGQAMRLARQAGLTLEPRYQEVLDRALQRLSPRFADQLRIYQADTPTAESLAALAARMEPARFAPDVGFDIGNLALLSRRYLAGAVTADDPRLACYAIELLADQSIVRTPDDSETVRAPSDPERPYATAQGLSRTGLGVALLGLDEASRLVRVEIVDGVAAPLVTEATEIFDAEAFDRWRQDYPQGYRDIGERRRRPDGTLEQTPDFEAFAETMARIGVSHLPLQRAVLILDTSLQSLPPNLLMVGGDFAARSRAMSTAPSLSWLRQAELRRARPAAAPRAWISTANPEGNLMSALPILADRLRSTLAEHNISLLTDPEIPDSLQGLEMAIIGAHGGLQAAEGRFFQSVSDEGHLRREGRTLAAALANTKVVILFVCSGGRLDANPAGRGVAGLARRLLDEGCSAVIASPWPMTSLAPPYWLPAFLEAWGLGLPVVDANHYANDAVRKQFGDGPEVCLAMSVYGDPLVRKVEG